MTRSSPAVLETSVIREDGWYRNNEQHFNEILLFDFFQGLWSWKWQQPYLERVNIKK